MDSAVAGVRAGKLHKTKHDIQSQNVFGGWWLRLRREGWWSIGERQKYCAYLTHSLTKFTL